VSVPERGAEARDARINALPALPEAALIEALDELAKRLDIDAKPLNSAVVREAIRRLRKRTAYAALGVKALDAMKDHELEPTAKGGMRCLAAESTVSHVVGRGLAALSEIGRAALDLGLLDTGAAGGGA